MHKFLFLLVITLVLLASGDALSPPQVGSKSSKLTSPDVDGAIRAVDTQVDANRLLRVQTIEDDVVDEERGMTGVTEKLKTWSQSFAGWAKNSKLGQVMAKQFQKMTQQRRDWKVSGLIKKGSSDTVLLQNKVTPDEFFKAKGLNPSLKNQASSPSAWKENPGLQQYFSYNSFWKEKQVV